MVADSTGFSTGPHTHIGLYRVDYDGKRIDVARHADDAAGSFAPNLFFTLRYAVDVADVGTLMKSALRYMKYLSGL